MDIVAKALAPVRRAAHQFFSCHLQLRVRGGLHIELVERTGPVKPASPAEQARIRQREELRTMLTQLGEVLNDDPDARHTLRHLAFLEQSLLTEGLAALQSVPLDVLQRGLVQFEELVTNWGPEGLANLRSRMAVALHNREAMDLMSEQQVATGQSVR